MQRTLLTLALIATAGVAHAQSMSTSEPTDPYGRPLIGRNDWVRQPADQPGPATGGGMNPGMTAVPMAAAPAASYPASSYPTASYAASSSMQPVAGEPTDPYGRPLIGRNDWVRQPGDQPGTTGSAATTSAYGGSYMSSTMGSGSREAVMRDEFGHRYDAQGNRLDARGNIISPQTP